MRYHVPTAIKCPKAQSSSGIWNTHQTNPLKPLQDDTQKSGVQGLGIKFLKFLVLSPKSATNPMKVGALGDYGATSRPQAL